MSVDPLDRVAPLQNTPTNVLLLDLMKVLAEGMEISPQIAFLMSRGCLSGQGCYSVPVPWRSDIGGHIYQVLDKQNEMRASC